MKPHPPRIATIFLFTLTSLLSSCAHEPARVLTSEKSNHEEARSRRTPWSGSWWPMQSGELVLGWEDGKGRKRWTPEEVQQFDSCLASSTSVCVKKIEKMASEQGKGLSPLMKFDLYIYKNVERFFPKGVPSTAFSHASRRELEIHYIGDNTHHRYWNSRGFAGKCLGWALSTFDFNEPTRDRVIDGILFRPADIKGILAALYNAAQFFIPENAVIGKEFHDASNSSKAAHEDVTPPDFIRSLRRTIQRGSLMEADLDPGDGVWNYPIYRYELDYTVGGKVSTPTASVRAKIYYADDEVEIDDVFSTKENRTDLKDRELTFELTLPKDWGGDISRATSGTWTGESVDKHPDVIIEGIEKGWRKTIYEYANTNMKEEVNFQLLKRVKIKGNEWTPIVDELLKRYYAK